MFLGLECEASCHFQQSMFPPDRFHNSSKQNLFAHDSGGISGGVDIISGNFLPPLREIAGKSHEIKFEFSPGGPRSILTECNRFTTYRSLSDEEFQRRLQIMPSLAEKNARKHQPACLSKSAAMISATNGRIDSQVINSPEERYITGE